MEKSVLKRKEEKAAGINAAAALALAQERYAQRTAKKPVSFVSMKDLSAQKMAMLLEMGRDIKKNPLDYKEALKHKSVALLFQKTSTRTRCSFEVGAVELGAHASYIDWSTSNFILSDLQDEAIALSRFYHLIMARVKANETITTMAAYSEVPIINGLCNKEHPCQAIADYMTMTEYFGADLSGLKIAYIGDGNNVCRSLVYGAALMGCSLALCSPDGYKLDRQTLEESDGAAFYASSPQEAVQDADVIYTDTWVSMGDEAEKEARVQAFASYQINDALMAKAPKHALFMHCLPAHPGLEVSAEVLRCPRSVVFDQAENRKHAQKAIMVNLLK